MPISLIASSCLGNKTSRDVFLFKKFIVSGIVLVHRTFVSFFVARQEAWWVEVLFSGNRCDCEDNKTSAGYEELIYLVGSTIRVTKGCRSNSLNRWEKILVS